MGKRWRAPSICNNYNINDNNNLFNCDDGVDLFAAPHISSHIMFDTDNETDIDNDQDQT